MKAENHKTASVLILFSFIGFVVNEKGSYPPTENVGLFRPISTNGDITCGSGSSSSSYCEPAEDANGLEGRACNKKGCNLECPGRDRKTDGEMRYINVMDGNLQNCITPNFEDTRGTRKPSYDFQNHPSCFARPTNVLRAGTAPGQFTLAVWIKQQYRNAGVIVEKVASPRPGMQRQVVLSVMVGAFSILLQYRGTDGRSHLKVLRVPFPPNNWHHLSLQAYNMTVNAFIDGLGSDETPTLSEQLEIPIEDINYSPIVKIGQRMQGTGQFVGRLHDYRWYETALTNREIQEVFSGEFKELNIQSNCLCPRGYPRVHPLEERYCIENGVPDTTENRRLRLHEDAHPLEYTNDGNYDTSWISANFYMPGGVTMTIDMKNGEYQVFSILLQFYSPQPQAITISRLSNRTTDGAWKPWGHFADDCEMRFKMPDNAKLTQPDSYNCIAFPPEEEIPYSNNNITFNLLSGHPFPRPGKDEFYNNPTLMNFIMAEKIRLRMQYQYFTLGADVAVPHQVYAIREIRITGRCNCHGHADACDMKADPYQCRCVPRSNTGGYLCEQCLPLFNNKPFHEGTQTEAFNCKPCECHQHANSCHYDESLDPYPKDFYNGGGGRCDNCQHHTTGINCEECTIYYYRLEGTSLNDPNVCLSCNCHEAGVVNGTMDCEKVDGQCECKSRVLGRTCNICVDGYYALKIENSEGCIECQCHLPGTVDRDLKCLQEGGQCNCKKNVRERTCSKCMFGFKNLRDSNEEGCEACDCHELGAEDQYCNSETGDCKCKPHVGGMHCDVCENGFWRLSAEGCEPCGCDISGSVSGTVCNKVTGQCQCKANTDGRTCNTCKDIFFNLTMSNEQGCQNCHCDPRGTIDGSLICDKETGDCNCKVNVQGRVCNECKGNTFGLDWDSEDGCEDCDCDPTGTKLGDEVGQHELVCDSNTGKCACMSSREGRQCDTCSPGYYLPQDGGRGCYDCDCHSYASVSKICSNTTGQCECKDDVGLVGRKCDQCEETYWNFHDEFGTCEECGCDIRGSLNATCNVMTGICSCKGNVIGMKCDECREGTSLLTAQNPMGCYSRPEQQAPPYELNKTDSQIELEWYPPDLPNGDSLQYKLYRNSELIFSANDSAPFSTMYFNDTSLLPYTNYDYYIETSNIGGTTKSADVRFQTIAGIPTGVPPLTVSNVKSRSATFEWSEPAVAHGPIKRYVLQSFDNVEFFRHPKEHYSDVETKVTIEDLRPFVNYTFTLRACTTGGCGDSLPLTVITPEDKPEEQESPKITALSNTSLLVEWDSPKRPNGPISYYEVFMRGKPDENGVHSPLQRVAFQTHGYYNPRPQPEGVYMPMEEPETNFTMNKLEPYTEYQFLVLSRNGVGSAESPWTTGRTLEGRPVFIDKPRAWAVSSSQINITWQEPDAITEVRGEVERYQVRWLKNNTDNPHAPPIQDVLLYASGRNTLNYLAKDLDPYVNYTLFMRLCNSVSCVKSDTVTVRTLPAAPEGQGPPTQKNQDTHSISMTWELPDRVNGPNPQFSLYQSSVSFSEPPTEMSRGIRFPGHSYLRFSPDILPKDASYSGIQLKFRTLQENALLFFAASKLASDYTRHEYIVLQLKNGRPWFLFDLQNSPTAITIDNDELDARYNDGKWHRIEINRFERDGHIELDLFTGSASSHGRAKVYGISEAIYIGGLPRDYNIARPHDKGSAVVVADSFVGCIKDITVRRNGMLEEWSNVTFSEAVDVYRTYDDWQGCPDVLDVPATHFLGRGFLKLKNQFNITNVNSWNVRMQIRVAFSSGILFYASGKSRNFMMGTINNGTLRFIISISDDDYHDILFDSTSINGQSSLCDGNWHSVEFRNDDGQLILILDGNLKVGPKLKPEYKNIDLSKKFYLGGIEDRLMSGSSFLLKYFEEDARSFGGCMRSILVNSVELNLVTESIMTYNVDLDGCPTGAQNSHVLLGSGGSANGASGSSGEISHTEEGTTHSVGRSTCSEASLTLLYEGHDFNYSSLNLKSFMQYLYRVTASNNGGDTRSTWDVMRVGEGIPETVGSPYDVRHVSGHVVEVLWRRPYHSKGIIVNYTLSARRLEDELPGSNSTIDITFDGGLYNGSLETLQPWSRYDVYLSACTKIGCAHSIAGFSFVTSQEPPYDVGKPTGSVTEDSMTLRWSKPQNPNGKIVSYALFHNSSRVYTGNNTHYTINGLATFQQQRFKVEACTIAGCNVSEEVVIHSSQLPPGHVDPPMLTILGPNALEIRWLKPAILNGIFDRYLLYLSQVHGELGNVVYNSTEPFLEYEMNDLLAGMDYFVTLEACTGGGCKRSTATPTLTTESVPQDIPRPQVISRSPYSFDVTWFEPGKPNGIITNYSLYFDKELRYTTQEPSSRHIEMLTPYSRHEFRVEACTEKGCASSPHVINRTMESKPEGAVTVSVTIVNSREVDAIWNMPVRQNGIMNYTVSCTGLFFINNEKKDFREIYETRILHVGLSADEWTRIEGLLPYTDYVIQVNASNSKGYILSNMRTVSMPPGAPDGVKPPKLVAVNPHKIIATWKDPARNNAPGNSFFQLQYRRTSPLEIETNAFVERTRQMSFILDNLKPHEEYEFLLIALNSFGSTGSEWTSIYTQQAPPEHLTKPLVYDLTSWSLSLRWKPPKTKNGIIQNYTIYQNDIPILTLSPNITHYILENLKPFTWYDYILEACTMGGCTKSDVTPAQTAAAAPEQLSPPEARSESPTSIFITWKPPQVQNGILDNYVLERRSHALTNSSDSSLLETTILGSFVPSQSLRYLDVSSILQPYTSYEYRVISSTVGGDSITSDWTVVTTRPGRPGGIPQPIVSVLTARSVFVEWEAPESTNGPVIKYEVLLPDPKFVVNGTDKHNLTVTDLIPYTDYQVSVIACTDGGCSESLKTDITTLTSVPEDLEPPTAIPISESYIAVQWKPPKFLNGPGIFYELTRTKLSQPLLKPQPDDIDVPVTIYKGTDLSYQDRGKLEKFTTVSYSLSCFNVDGSIISNVTTVTTLGGIPITSPTPQVSVHNHTSIQITWETPSVFDLQGAVLSYFIKYEQNDGVEENLSFSPEVTSTVLNDFYPGTNYTFILTVDNGAHNISSEKIFVKTKDGAPEGVFPPVVYSLSASELHASWLEPRSPNGEIIKYTIILDDTKIEMSSKEPSSYILTDLQPFTVYNLQLEACTKYACAVSETVQATTQETLPMHLEKPLVKILGANKIEISWTPPRKENGILKFYEVRRRSLLPCYKLETEDDTKICNYIKCKKNERPCSSTCFSSSVKVCCDGNLFFKKAGFDCCGGKYIKSKTNVTDICCAGKFYPAMKNYQCCGKRYVQVLKGEKCCRDENEDRVSVGAGDSCCGVIPYYSNGVQICCDNHLHDGFKKKCCGKQITDAADVCCGKENAEFYQTKIDHECCGNKYISKHDSLCCRDNITGKEMVHFFDAMKDEDKMMKCCSVNLIHVSTKCCNGRGYDSSTHVCADVGTMMSKSKLIRCGNGAVCSINQAPSAFCDRCDFDLNVYNCFISQDVASNDKSAGDLSSMCATSYVTVFTGAPDKQKYTDDTVEAHTRYEYKVTASNKMGAVESEEVAVTTFQSIPDEVDSPQWTSNNQDTITLTWKEPKKPNGIITRYAILRDNLEIWGGLAFQHTDTFQILPFKRYSYILKACTYVGCSNSSPILATSIQGVPGNIQSPLLTIISPYNISITWTKPTEANGLITRYTLNETKTGTIYTIDPVFEDSSYSYHHTNLQPHSTHSYILTACTIAGCSTSDEVSVTTAEAKPEGVWKYPAALSIDMSTVELFWNEPEKPNGIIREYRLMRKKILKNESLNPIEHSEFIYQGGPDQLNYTDTMLEPETVYDYELIAINGAGFGRSEPHRVKMPKNIPSQTPNLEIRVTGSQTLLAEWSLDDGQSVAYKYSVIIQRADVGHKQDKGSNRRSKRSVDDHTSTQDANTEEKPILIYSTGFNQTYVIEKLSPYTLYKIRVRVCLPDDPEDVDCITGEEKTVRTLPAPPKNQFSPELRAVGPRVVDIEWKPPRKPNGVITQYQIYRRLTSDSNSEEKLIFSTGDIDRQWFTDSDPELTPFTRYEYRVRVRNSEGVADSSWSHVTTMQDVPQGIKKPTVTVVSAFAVKVSWTEPEMPNGNIVSYSLEYRDEPDDPTIKREIVKPVTVPSILREAYISGLEPFTNYEMRLVVVNSADMEARSDWVSVKTSSAAPSSVENFSVVQMEDGRSLLLTWDPPTVPNGEITTYNIYEYGFDTPLQSGLFRQFHMRRLKPFTEYTLILEACTGHDLCTTSPPQTFTTAETAPEMQPSPTVSLANTSAVSLSWSRPKELNGILLNYKVLRNEIPRTYYQSSFQRQKRSTDSSQKYYYMIDEDLWIEDDSIYQSYSIFDSFRRIRRSLDDSDLDGAEVIYQIDNPKENSYSYTDTNLKPYTKYLYRIRSSTNAGFVDSEEVTAETHQAPPSGLSNPVIAYTSDRDPTKLIVKWSPPEELNGVIQTYRVQKNSSTPLSFPATQFQFTDSELQPYTLYSYSVSACTSGGCTESPVSVKRTLEEAPLFVSPPTAVAISSSALHVEWTKPTITNGVIRKYQVFIDDELRYEGLSMETIIEDLKPFMLYSVSLSACTSSGCRRSESKVARTSEAPPLLMASPELHVTSPHSIEVTWDSPLEANGKIIRYELKRNNELIFVSDGVLERYHDFELKPGTTYTYFVTAYNKKGSVKSDKAIEMTDPAAPSGLEPPTLTATTSSSIHAKWDSPASPNGIIVNFTLYSRHINDRKDEKIIKLAGNVFEYSVHGLMYYQDYSFWLQSCTKLGCVMSERTQQKTLEGIPSGQKPPQATLLKPDDIFLSITWEGPEKPNGNILLYKLFRQRVIETVASVDTVERVLAYNGTAKLHADLNLLPYTKYQYQIRAENSAGGVTSDWSSLTRTGEAAPKYMAAPSFGQITERSVQVIASEPKIPNGIIKSYTVYARRNVSAESFVEVSTSNGPDQTAVNLIPFTSYEFQVKACTLKHLCVTSPLAYTSTSPAPPRGQNPPHAVSTFSRNVTLQWSAPIESNGIINSYEVHMRKSCPPPYQQQVETECLLGPATITYGGVTQQAVIRNLSPYENYDFCVVAVNDHGRSKSEWMTETTSKALPKYKAPILVTSNISSIYVVWTNSFQPNGIVMQYELTDDKKHIYSGLDTMFYIRRTASMVHKFQVKIITDIGDAESPYIMHDTGKGRSYIEGRDDSDESQDPDILTTSVPVYETIWFIAVIALISIMLIFTILAVILRRISGRYDDTMKMPIPPLSLDQHQFSNSNTSNDNSTRQLQRKISQRSIPISTDQSFLQDPRFIDANQFQNQSFVPEWTSGYNSQRDDIIRDGFGTKREKTAIGDTHL